MYELEQQGSSVEVKCSRPNPEEEPFIESAWTSSSLGVANVSSLCPSQQNNYTYSLGLYSGQSVTASLCTGLRRGMSKTNRAESNKTMYHADYSGEYHRGTSDSQCELMFCDILQLFLSGTISPTLFRVIPSSSWSNRT